jgi:predicted PurR-regulated permease PerM
MVETTPLLSPVQRKLVGFALGLTALLAIVVLFALIVVGLSRALGFFSGVIWPLAAAGILALILRPVVTLFEKHLHLNRLAAVILLFALFLLLLAGLIVAIAPMLVSQTLDFVGTLPKLWEQVSTYVQMHYPDWAAFSREKLQNPAVKKVVDGLVAQGSDLLAGLLPSVAAAFGQIRNTVSFLVSLAVVPVFLFFFLMSDADASARLSGLLPFLRPAIRDDVVYLSQEFVGIVVTFFRGQMLIGLIMGTFYATGFSFAGLKFGLVIGLAMGLLDIIPYLGSILGLSVALPLAFFQPGGGWWLVGAVLAVFGLAQAVGGLVLTPRILGRRTGLHPMAIIVAIFFWGTALNGLLGMVLAIPLTAFFVTVWRLLRHKYFGAPAESPAPPVA